MTSRVLRLSPKAQTSAGVAGYANKSTHFQPRPVQLDNLHRLHSTTANHSSSLVRLPSAATLGKSVHSLFSRPSLRTPTLFNSASLFSLPMNRNANTQARKFSTAQNTTETVGSITGKSIAELEQLSNDEINALWIKSLMHGPCVSGVIPVNKYEVIHLRANQNPMFVFPLPCENGFRSIFFQAKGDRYLFTPLERYQQQGVESLPSLVLNTFHDLRSSKNIVLLKGTVEVPTLKPSDAQLLVNMLQIFLLDDTKYEKMVQFNQNPASFNYQDVIKIVETGLQ